MSALTTLRGKVSRGWVFAALLVVTLLLAGVVSYFASSAPDGLERVAGDHGMAETQQEHAAQDSPTADYGVEGVDNSALSGGLAGVAGVAVVLTLGAGLAFAVRRKQTPDRENR